jgi:hypothetical protein
VSERRRERRERANAARAARRDKWASMFAPWATACAGAAISLAFLFQRSLGVRAAMFLVFFAAARLAGKRMSLVATVLVSAGIAAANLLVPVGRVLAQLGPLKITETALLDGIGKALVFEGLICVSKASILPGLRLPGRFGELVAAAFVYYDRIVEYKGSIKAATLIEDADRLMLSMWEKVEGATEQAADPDAAARAAIEERAERESAARAARGGMRPAAALALAAAVAASYLPFLLKL